MGDQKLTRRQRQILDFINSFEAEQGYAPSYREIGEAFNLSSPATIHEHVRALADKGFLTTDYNRPRSIELVKVKPNWAQAVELTLAGLITAGEPIEAIESTETIAVPVDFVTDSFNSYVLQVKGESMIEDGILDGDYVVVALLNNAYATLKKFYRETNRIRLQPANSSMAPIYVQDLIVQGVVKAVIRRFT